MNSTIRKGVGALSLSLGMLGTAFISPAHATVLACGDLVTTSVTLTADVGPCPATGLTVIASNLTLNLGGHKVFGMAVAGQGVGVGIGFNRTNVTVTNGEITAFDAGVAALGGSGHHITALNVHDNIGLSDGDFGDGITLNGTDNSFIQNNQVIHNGPYDGIGMFGDTDGNTITGNVVRNNNVLGTHHGTDPAMQDTGIRLEPGSDGNLVQANSVTGNGLDGIEIFANSDTNTVRFNQVSGNGFNNNPAGGLRVGDGINAFSGANGNVIQSNQSTLNAGSGIKMYTGATSNNILTNQAIGNNGQPNVVSTGYDLADLNPACDSNGWHLNVGITFNMLCVLAL